MMRVVSVPQGLKLALAFFSLCVPIMALEVVIATRSPWWKLPYESIAFFSLIAGGVYVFLTYGALNGRRWALHCAGVLCALWSFATAWIAVKMNHPSLGFFSIFLVFFCGGLILWIRFELSRSFFDPQMNWYQGLPKAIPGVKCEWLQGEKKVLVKVSRIDREGAFIFSTGSLGALKPGEKSELEFEFRKMKVRCPGVPMRSLSYGVGAGFQFQEMPPDLRKDLGDFIESLRGEGYVQ